jgi:hypothetical protein
VAPHLSSTTTSSRSTRTQLPLKYHFRSKHTVVVDPPKQTTPKQIIIAKMQFSVVSIVVALAATVSAQYIAPNGTAVYPTGTGSPSGAVPSASVPFTGAAAMPTGAGSAMAVLAVGAAALVSLLTIP